MSLKLKIKTCCLHAQLRGQSEICLSSYSLAITLKAFSPNIYLYMQPALCGFYHI